MISTMQQLMIAIIFIRFYKIDSYEIDNNIDMNDLSSLSELPLGKLLTLREKVKHGTDDSHDILNKSTLNKLQGSAFEESAHTILDKSKGPVDRTSEGWMYDDHTHHGYQQPHYNHQHYDGENLLWLKTKGNIQTIFQTTVTVLAFLAFGGYLICVVMATFKGGPQGQVVVQQSTSTVNTDNRVVKRSIDNLMYKQFESRYKQSINETHMFALCQVAEGYAKYYELSSNYG